MLCNDSFDVQILNHSLLFITDFFVHSWVNAVADPGFPRDGAPTLGAGGANIRLLQNFPQNCMKLKKFGPGGHASKI